jgi:hypothetical protein
MLSVLAKCTKLVIDACGRTAFTAGWSVEPYLCVMPKVALLNGSEHARIFMTRSRRSPHPGVRKNACKRHSYTQLLRSGPWIEVSSEHLDYTKPDAEQNWVLPDMKITVAEGPGVRQLKLMRSPRGSNLTSSSRSDYSCGDALQPAELSHHSQLSSRGHLVESNTMLGRSIYEAWDASLIGSALERAFAGERVVEEMEIEGRWFRTQYTPMREEWELTGERPGMSASAITSAEARDQKPVVGVVGASMVRADSYRASAQLIPVLAQGYYRAVGDNRLDFKDTVLIYLA